jgi:tetratricopeptide (TPR) repeat protein
MTAALSASVSLVGSVPRVADAASVGAANFEMRALAPDVAPNAPAQGAVPSEPDPSARAMELFRRGSELYSQAKYSAALDAFLDAQSLYPSPDFHYNIGACYEQLENYEQAVRSFQSYLRNRSDAPDRANIEVRIARLSRIVEERKKSNTQASGEPSTRSDEPASETTKAGDPVRSDSQPSMTPRSVRPLLISGTVLAATGLLGGAIGVAIFGVQANGYAQDVEELNAGNNPENLTFDESYERAKKGQRAENYQFVSAAIGGGVAITGAVLLGLGLYKKNQAKASTQAHKIPTLDIAWRRDQFGITLRGAF